MRAYLLVFVLALSGCQNHREDNTARPAASALKPGEGTTKLTPNWKDGELGFTEMKASAGFYSSDGKYRVTFRDLPPGSIVKIGGEDVASSNGNVSKDIDIAPLLGTVATKDAFASHFDFDPKLELQVKVPGYATVQVQAPPTWLHEWGEIFEKAIDHPVDFGDLASASPKQHTIFYNATVGDKVLGPAKTLSEIDWVAIRSKQEPRSGGTCSGFTGKKGTLPLELVDEEITVVERKTSKVIDKKLFKAPTPCPMFAVGDTASNSPDPDLVRAWLRTIRSKT